jgi:hypothetical protein
MIALALATVVSIAAVHTSPFEITNNKPFVRVTVNGSGPQSFILDTGNNAASILARECADRLGLTRGAEQKAQIGAGAGVDAGISTADRPITYGVLGETLTVATPTVLTLGHVARLEGRRVDGLIGADFLARHVVTLDYAKSTITTQDPERYAPPAKATVVPLELDTGWPIVVGTVTPRGGGEPISCRLIVDTGVRGVVTLFRPFSARNGLLDPQGGLRDRVTGAGAGGITRGDVGRLASLALGAATFADPVATFSRDTTGIFSLADPADGILGGELLRRHRVTFDCPHARLVLEPYANAPATFEYDASGLFLEIDDPERAKIRVLAVGPDTPAAEAGLRVGDEVVSIDGKKTPKLTLSDARVLLRDPVVRKLEVRREDATLSVRLACRRLV